MGSGSAAVADSTASDGLPTLRAVVFDVAVDCMPSGGVHTVPVGTARARG